MSGGLIILASSPIKCMYYDVIETKNSHVSRWLDHDARVVVINNRCPNLVADLVTQFGISNKLSICM